MSTKPRFDAGGRMDAPTSAFFANQLETIRPKVVDIVYPEFTGRALVPINNSINPGATEYTYRWYDHVGAAKFITDYATDLPRVDVKGTEESVKFHNIGDSYGWSLQEIETSRYTGTALDTKKAAAAKRAIEQLIDDTLTVGEANRGLLGLFNQPISGASAVGTYTNTAGSFATADPVDVLDELNAAILAARAATLDAERITDIVMPLSMAGIATRRMEAGDSVTILKAFQETAPGVTVTFHVGLETAGASNTRRIVMYNKSPDKVEGMIPREFTQEAPEYQSLQVVTACHARVGGVVVYYPKSIRYIDAV